MSEVARRRYRRWSFRVAIPVVILVSLHDSGSTTLTAPDGGRDSSPKAGPGSASFTIEGNASQVLFPGVTVPLDLQITNPFAFPMSVSGLTVSVHEVNAPNSSSFRPCSVADFVLVQASSNAEITVAVGSTSSLSALGLAPGTWPRVGMLNRTVNQDGCQGGGLTLRYTASGTLVD